jgi:hypothetical protein
MRISTDLLDEEALEGAAAQTKADRAEIKRKLGTLKFWIDLPRDGQSGKLELTILERTRRTYGNKDRDRDSERL